MTTAPTTITSPTIATTGGDGDVPAAPTAGMAGGAAARERLRVAVLAPPMESIPPPRYGGTERVVAVLCDELVRRGHDVTLFASGDSRTSAHLVPTIDVALWHHPRYRDIQPFIATSVDVVYRRAGEFDVIHNHLGFPAFPAARLVPTPTVTTLHGRLDLPELTPLHHHFAGMPLVSISDAQRAPLPDAWFVATVYHGIDLRPLRFQPRSGSYLAFLGRISPTKGLDTAIRVAHRTGIPLKIAARMPLDIPGDAESRTDWDYFHTAIEPHLREPGIEYVGEVSDGAKSDFLGGAAALLFPIRWPEPFGLVMPEALACGTPVLALRWGSAPELIDHGRTGFVVDTEDELVGAVDRLGGIERAACRLAVEARFSPAVMAAGYERVYRQVVTAAQCGGQAGMVEVNA